MKTRITSIIAFTLLLPFTSLMAQNPQIDFDGMSKNQTQLNLRTDLSIPEPQIKKMELSKWEIENNLRKLDGKYRKLIEASNEGIMVILDGDATYSNRALLDMLNYDKNKFLDLELSDIISEEANTTDFKNFTIALEKENLPTPLETKLKSKTKKTLDALLTASKIDFVEKNSFIIIIKDMRQNKKTQEDSIELQISLFSLVQAMKNNDFEVTDILPERPDVPILDDGIEEETIPENTGGNFPPPQFLETDYNKNQADALKLQYNNLDPEGKIPANLLEKALAYYDSNIGKIKNKNYLSIIDFSKHSSKSRFFIINMNSGEIKALHVAHGKNSDADADGYATHFSNTPNSLKSSLGFYSAAELYHGKHGLSMRLDGLSTTNSNARSRAVVIHASNYVQDANVQAGRSWGCPAVSNTMIKYVTDNLHGGSILYTGLSGTY
jgi:PAS domain S-box-containing protein